MKRVLVELATQLVALIVVILAAGLVGGFLGLTIGAVANAVAPDFQLQMADRLGFVCPQGETINIDHSQTVSGVDANGHAYAGQSNDLYCVSNAEGTRRELSADEYLAAKAAALGVAMGGYSLLFFVVFFVPGEALALFVLHKGVAVVMKPAAVA